MRSDRAESDTAVARPRTTTRVRRRAALAAAVALVAGDLCWADPPSYVVTGPVTVDTFAEPNGDGTSYYFARSSANLTFNGGVQVVIPIAAVTGQNLNWNSNAAWNDPGIALVNEAAVTQTYTDLTNTGVPPPSVFLSAQPSILSLPGGGPTRQVINDTNYYTVSVPDAINPYSESYGITVNETFDVTIPGSTSMTLGQTEELQQLTIAAGAGFVLGNNATLTISNAIINRATLTIESGTVVGPLYNSGQLTLGGTLNVMNAATNSGNISVSGTVNASAGFTNSGVLVLNGNINVGSGILNNTGTLNLSTGSIGADGGTYVNSGTMNWTGGVIQKLVNTSSTLVVNIPSGAGINQGYLSGTLDNQGTIEHQSGTVVFAGGATLTNEAGATYDLQSDGAAMDIYPEPGVNTFKNAGLFKKSAGTGMSMVRVPFDNTGTIEADSGTLSLTYSGSSTGGRFVAAAGATVDLGGTFDLHGTNIVAGTGTVYLSGNVRGAAGEISTLGGTSGTLLTGGDLYGDTGGALYLNMTGAGVVLLSSGYVGGPGQTVNQGNFNWTTGDVSGNLTNASRSFNVNIPTTAGFIQGYLEGTLDNRGTIAHQSGTMVFAGGATLTNEAGATYDLQSDTAGMSVYYEPGVNTINNAGLFEKTGGTGTSTVGVTFNNLLGGKMSPITGTLSFTGGLTNAGAVTMPAGGELLVSGTLQQSAGGVFTSAGTFAAGGFVNAGGTATVGGVQQWAGGSTFNNADGSATFTTDAGANLSVVAAGGTVTFAATQHLAGLVVGNGATVFVAQKGAVGARPVVVVPTLAVAAYGVVDVSGGDLDVTGGNLSAITALAGEGYNAGGTPWAGDGIDSAAANADRLRIKAVGVIGNDQGGPSLYSYSNPFDGVVPGAADVLVKYTYYGDANLDGTVDGQDYGRIDAGYASQASASPLTGWYNGDFNYDGRVDGSDYTLIDNAFNNQPRAAAATAEVAAGETGAAAVPEPAAAVAMTAGAVGWAALRRRRRAVRGLCSLPKQPNPGPRSA